ncbi:MAG: glycosyltransferase family 39 protein [Planctomycetes bacterium]|nr:glycosyltransferase family 39 protein [Planctomycetota bacterium]
MSDRPGLPRMTFLIVVAATAVGMLLRASRLTESLWYDEIAAWTSHGVLGPRAIVASFAEPSNHIAHTLLSWYSVTLFEPALGFALALRLPALLFSLAAITAVWGLARQVLGPRPAIFAAGFMAVLPVAVLEGTEARGYSMMICFSALASWTLLANIARERTWRWALYAALIAMGVWVHFVTAFVAIGHASWLAWRAARHREIGLAARGGAAIGVAALVTIALYAPALPELLAGRGMYGSSRGDEPSVFGPQGVHALLQLGGSWYIWAALPGLALAVAGAATVPRSATPRPSPRDAAALTLLGLPIFLVVVLVAGSWMYARFALFSLPGAVLLMAVGLDRVWVRHRAAGIAAGLMVVAASLADLAVRPARQPLGDAAALVRDRLGDGERILVVGLAHRVIDVYLADLDPQYSFMHGADLERKLTQIEPAWIVLYYPDRVSDGNYALLDERGYELVERFPGWADWTNGDVLVYRDSR